jgi:hypothetical protein
LTFFRPAADKKYNSFAIFAEVNPIARAKFNALFKNPGPNALGFGQIALLDACESRCHLGRRFPVQTIGPNAKRTLPILIDVLAHFDRR